MSRFGGKANALAEMLSLGLPVPIGFAIAAEAREGRRRGRHGGEFNPICPELDLELRAAWVETIGSSKAAVRSSALLEDSADASFAGQFRSVLNVESPEELLEAVRECWESAHTGHASAYAERKAGVSKGARPNEMGVVVQRMVDAQYAGVVFSRDPATDSSDVLFAEWVDGLGEDLVGGERLAGRCWLASNGAELRTDHLGESAPPRTVWRELADAVKRIERHFGVPQDVEWAVGKDGLLQVLQARPITTQPSSVSGEGPPPWLLPGRPAGGWTELQRRYFDLWDEYCAASVTPLDYGLFTREIWQASLTMLDEGEGVPSIDAVVIRFLEVPVAVNPATERRIRHHRRGESTVEASLATWRLQVESLKGRIGDLRLLDDAALMETVEEAGRLHGYLTSTRLLGMHEWIEGERSCAEELGRLTGLDHLSEEALDDLCAGVDHETARMNTALEQLMRKSEAATARSEWLDDFERFIERFGHMEINGTVAHSAKDDLIAYLEAGSPSGGTVGTRTTPAGANERARRQRQRVLEGVEADRRVAAERCISRLRELRVVREDSKSLANLPLPILRDAVVEATRRLQSRGLLSSEATADVLTVDELRRGLVLGAELPTAAQARQSAIGWKQQHSWLPAGFAGEACRSSQESFTGLGASPGNAAGAARVVRGLPDFAKVERGDVLVAPSTNPAWTILFGRVAAVVVENGSRLSHAAIVAREYGIPAVVGLPGICDAIVDGEEIRVDGDAGNVERVTALGKADA